LSTHQTTDSVRN